MREHMGVFRGKLLNSGEWIEGSLVKATLDGKTYHLIIGDNFSFIGNDVRAHSHALVDPATVGECTGLRDKNGKLIFEGDVLKMGARLCRVRWQINGWAVTGRGVDSPLYTYCWEIVGNIHDNELLKGGNE